MGKLKPDLGYGYEAAFGENLYTASFRELHYPNSKQYHDLDAWINVELASQGLFGLTSAEKIPALLTMPGEYHWKYRSPKAI